MIINKRKNLILLLLLISCPSLSASNEPILISNNNPFRVFEVSNFTIGPNSEYVVYAQESFSGITNRYNVNLNNPTAINLIETEISFFETFISSDIDMSRFIYRNNQTGGLTSIQFNGQSTIQLAAPESETITIFSNLNDNTPLQVFKTSEGNLYSINENGTQPANLLSTNLRPSLDSVDRFQVSSDRLSVIYSANIESLGVQQIFSVAIDGSSNPVLVHTLPINSNLVDDIIISQDNSRIIYIVETSFESNVKRMQLYSSPINGSSLPSKLGNTVDGFQVDIDFKLSESDTFVAFLLEGDTSSLAIDDPMDSLFTIPIDASSAPTLIDSENNIIDFQITNDSQNIVYTSEEVTGLLGQLTSLFTSPSDGSSTPINIRVNDSSSFDIHPNDFRTSSDSQFIFYVATQLDTLSSQIFRVNTDGSGESLLISDNRTDYLVDNFKLDSINSRIFYSTIGLLTDSDQLFSVNYDGTELSPLTTFSGRIDFSLSPDANTLVYRHTPLLRFESLFALDVSIEPKNTCFPIKAKNDKFITICL